MTTKESGDIEDRMFDLHGDGPFFAFRYWPCQSPMRWPDVACVLNRLNRQGAMLIRVDPMVDSARYSLTGIAYYDIIVHLPPASEPR